MNRIDRIDMLKEITKLVSRRGTCLRAQVGCVIARHGRIIVTGYNGAPPGEPHCLDVGCQIEDGHCVRTIHAEANAIAFAARYGISVEGCTLYSYGWAGGVCHRCNKLSLSAGITGFVEIPLDKKSSILIDSIIGKLDSLDAMGLTLYQRNIVIEIQTILGAKTI